MSDSPDSFDYRRLDAEAVVELLDILAELDDDERLDSPCLDDEDIAAMRGRVLSGVGDRLAQNTVDAIATLFISDVQAWLREVAGEALVRAASRMAEPRVQLVPELANSGYAAEVELEADTDPSRGVADITVIVTPSEDSAKPEPLTATITAPDGTSVSAPFSSFGVAIVKDVPLPAPGSSDVFQLSFHLRPGKRWLGAG